MPINILMPALSPTMTEGTLAKWLVKEGDEVSSGDVVAEIETDKATMEVETIDEGIVGKLLVAEGTDAVPVNQVIAVLLEEGEDASAISAAAPAAAPAPTAVAEAAPTTVNPQVTDAARFGPCPVKHRRGAGEQQPGQGTPAEFSIAILADDDRHEPHEGDGHWQAVPDKRAVGRRAVIPGRADSG